MAKLIQLEVMDLNSAAESVTFSAGLILSGAVEPQKIEEAYAKLVEAWPVLGAYARQNEQTKKIEAVIPDPNSAKLKISSQFLDKTLEQTEKPYARTNTISTQVITRNESLYRTRPLRRLDDYLSSGDAAFSLHAAYLLDATVLTLTIAHILMDASGFNEFIKALILALDGEPIPPLLDQDPWAVLLPEALRTPDLLDAHRGWVVWGAEEGLSSRHAEEKDTQADGPIQKRTIYFPAAEIARLKLQALEELRAAGKPVPFLSTNDVVVAWLYKHTFIDTNNDEKDNKFIYVIDARNRFPEAFLPGHAYLHNAWFNMTTKSLTDSQLHTMSLGEIAYMIRQSVGNQTAQDHLLSQMKWKYERAGQTQVAFSPGDRIHFSSSWLSFGLGNLNIAKHIKPGSGTGQVLDVVYDVRGAARGVSAIKFKDVDGGVACDMDWGVRKWESGEMAKYALENLS